MSANPAKKPAAKASASSKPRPSAAARRTTSRKKGAVFAAGTAVAAVLLGTLSYTATRPDSSPEVTSGEPAAEVSTDPAAGVHPELEQLARRDAGDKLAMGRADAPVVLVEYADFKCGYCGKFARDTEPALIEKYVDDGTLRIEWRNFPIFGKDSQTAARAAWAAGQQDRFWEFHRAAYEKGAKEKGFSKDRVTALAREAGVKDLGLFARDLDSAASERAVAKDSDEAYGLGATSTPSFLINGRPLAGAQPEEAFTAAIEDAKTRAKAKAEESGGAGKGADEKAGQTGEATPSPSTTGGAP